MTILKGDTFIKKVLVGVLVSAIFASCTSVAVFATSHPAYTMITSSNTSGCHEHFVCLSYAIKYACNVSGLKYVGESCTTKCYEDFDFSAQLIPIDQTFSKNGNATPWWNITQTGDYNLELWAMNSGSTVSTKGPFSNM